MRKKILAGVCMAFLLAIPAALAGCGASGEQRYAWPLATASPEDTVSGRARRLSMRASGRQSTGRFMRRIWSSAAF